MLAAVGGGARSQGRLQRRHKATGRCNFSVGKQRGETQASTSASPCAGAALRPTRSSNGASWHLRTACYPTTQLCGQGRRDLQVCLMLGGMREHCSCGTNSKLGRERQPDLESSCCLRTAVRKKARPWRRRRAKKVGPRPGPASGSSPLTRLTASAARRYICGKAASATGPPVARAAGTRLF